MAIKKKGPNPAGLGLYFDYLVPVCSVYPVHCPTYFTGACPLPGSDAQGLV